MEQDLLKSCAKSKFTPIPSHPIPSHHVCQVPEQGDGETDCLPSSIKVCLRNKCSSTKTEFISLFNNLTKYKDASEWKLLPNQDDLDKR